MTERLYSELADWYPLFTPVADYAEEAAFFSELLAPSAADPVPATAGPLTLLEIGSGQGANASYMKERFAITLVEPSAPMRALSEALNPALEHLSGDLRSLRLDRTFDRVFIHDAIAYITSEPDLAATFATVAAHLAPGGLALIAPDYLADNFKAGWDDGGSDHPSNGTGVRFIEHVTDPDPLDQRYTVDYAIMIHDHDGSVRVEHDQHIEGLFDRATWLRLAAAAGLPAETVVFDHSDLEDSHVYELILCRSPSAAAADQRS